MNESRKYGRRGTGQWSEADIAERLLSGEAVTDADPQTAALARLLTAAAQPLPGRPEHERAALDAFRQAARTRASHTRVPADLVPSVRPSRPQARASRPVKTLICGTMAVFLLGGVAIAAQTGALPQPFHPRPAAPRSPTAGSPPSITARTPDPPEVRGTTADPGTPHAPVGASPHAPSHSPSAHGAPVGAGAKGLCEAYVKAAHKGQTVDTASRARLAQAAGGAGQINAYCAQLTGPGGPAAPSSPAAVPSSPAVRPSTRASNVSSPHVAQSAAPGAGRQK